MRFVDYKIISKESEIADLKSQLNDQFNNLKKKDIAIKHSEDENLELHRKLNEMTKSETNSSERDAKSLSEMIDLLEKELLSVENV